MQQQDVIYKAVDIPFNDILIGLTHDMCMPSLKPCFPLIIDSFRCLPFLNSGGNVSTDWTEG